MQRHIKCHILCAVTIPYLGLEKQPLSWVGKTTKDSKCQIVLLKKLPRLAYQIYFDL